MTGAVVMKKTVFDKPSFVAKAQSIFGDFYDYSDFDYVSAKTKSTIHCPHHGSFQQNPDKHVSCKYPCPSCLNEHRSFIKKGITPKKTRDPLSAEAYLSRFQDKHGHEYELDLSSYISRSQGTITLFCKTHGETTYKPEALLSSKYACRHCALEKRNATKTKTYDALLDDLFSIYNDLYSYPESNRDTYINRRSRIEIVCPLHGSFYKMAQKHLSGQGCAECTYDKLRTTGKLPGGYSEQFFLEDESRKDIPAYIYYLKIGHLFKVGITTSLQNRVKSIRSESKKDVTIIDVYQTTLFHAYSLEQKLLKDYDDHRVYTKWSTELFKRDILDGIKLEQIQ